MSPSIKSISLTLLITWGLGISVTYAQDLALGQAYALARQNYPLLITDSLYDKTLESRLRALRTNFLPRLNIIGEISYQSDVPELPFQIPNAEPLDLPNERLQAYLDISQTIYDGGVTSSQKEIQKWEARISKQQLEVSLHQLKSQVLTVYFSISTARHTEQVFMTSADHLREKLSITEKAVEGGILDNMAVLQLKAEILKLEQQIAKIRQQIVGLFEVLSLLCGKEFSIGTKIIIPSILTEAVTSQTQVARPELKLVSIRKQQLSATEQLKQAARKPNVSAFGQGGVGYPNPYNFFDDSLSPFYLVGMRFNWNIWNWGKTKEEKNILRLQSEVLEAEKNNLMQNINIKLEEHLRSISELQAMIDKDQELLQAVTQIRQLASKQLDEGTISAGDYIDHVLEEQSTKLNLKVREVRLSFSKANYLNEKGLLFDHQPTEK